MEYFLYGGSDVLQEILTQKVSEIFAVGPDAGKESIFTGLRVTGAVERIQISQLHYTRQICPIQITSEGAHAADMPLTNKEKQAFQSTVGELLWAARQTRISRCVFSWDAAGGHR